MVLREECIDSAILKSSGAFSFIINGLSITYAYLEGFLWSNFCGGVYPI